MIKSISPTPFFFVSHWDTQHMLSQVMGAINRHQDELLADYARVPLPNTGIGGHIATGPFTFGGLITLWRELPEWWTGQCVVCAGAVRCYDGDALMTQGHIGGVCLSCGFVHVRDVPGITHLLSLVPTAVRESCYMGGPFRVSKVYVESHTQLWQKCGSLPPGANTDKLPKATWQRAIEVLNLLGEDEVCPPLI